MGTQSPTPDVNFKSGENQYWNALFELEVDGNDQVKITIKKKIMFLIPSAIATVLVSVAEVQSSPYGTLERDFGIISPKYQGSLRIQATVSGAERNSLSPMPPRGQNPNLPLANDPNDFAVSPSRANFNDPSQIGIKNQPPIPFRGEPFPPGNLPSRPFPGNFDPAVTGRNFAGSGLPNEFQGPKDNSGVPAGGLYSSGTLNDEQFSANPNGNGSRGKFQPPRIKHDGRPSPHQPVQDFPNGNLNPQDLTGGLRGPVSPQGFGGPRISNGDRGGNVQPSRQRHPGQPASDNFNGSRSRRRSDPQAVQDNFAQLPFPEGFDAMNFIKNDAKNFPNRRSQRHGQPFPNSPSSGNDVNFGLPKRRHGQPHNSSQNVRDRPISSQFYGGQNQHRRPNHP